MRVYMCIYVKNEYYLKSRSEMTAVRDGNTSSALKFQNVCGVFQSRNTFSFSYCL